MPLERPIDPNQSQRWNNLFIVAWLIFFLVDLIAPPAHGVRWHVALGDGGWLLFFLLRGGWID